MNIDATIDEKRDPQEAFTDAINHGRLCAIRDCAGNIPYAGDFMFMYATTKYDYFKNGVSRKYLLVERDNI